MARARNIKPGYFKNERLAECSPLTRLLFSGLWCLADRTGRLEDRPKRIRAEVLPYDDGSVDDMLSELQKAGFILRYQVGNERYIQVLNFAKHQNPHCREPESAIPAPYEHGASTVQGDAENRTGPADSLNLIPDSLNLKTESPFPDSPMPETENAVRFPLAGGCEKTPPPAAAQELVLAEPQKPRKAKPPAASSGVWDAYARAFALRYGTEPVRNARVNALMAQLVGRLGAEDAAGVAEFYLSHNLALYVRSTHDPTLLLRDAEGLRTQWVNGRKVTTVAARDADRMESQVQVWDQVKRELSGGHQA